jgi:hypothetical protein
MDPDLLKMKPIKITVHPKEAVRLMGRPIRAFSVTPKRAWRRQLKALLLTPNCHGARVEFSNGSDQFFFA